VARADDHSPLLPASRENVSGPGRLKGKRQRRIKLPSRATYSLAGRFYFSFKSGKSSGAGCEKHWTSLPGIGKKLAKRRSSFRVGFGAKPRIKLGAIWNPGGGGGGGGAHAAAKPASLTFPLDAVLPQRWRGKTTLSSALPFAVLRGFCPALFFLCVITG